MKTRTRILPGELNEGSIVEPNERLNHPYNKRVNALRISLIEEFKREPTTIDETDLIIPKRAEAFYKLYDLIERATKPGYLINELEYEFLVQMSEYWMVLEKDILDKTLNITDMTFYVHRKAHRSTQHRHSIQEPTRA